MLTSDLFYKFPELSSGSCKQYLLKCVEIKESITNLPRDGNVCVTVEDIANVNIALLSENSTQKFLEPTNEIL